MFGPQACALTGSAALYVQEGLRRRLLQGVPQQWQPIVGGLLTLDPAERMTAAQAWERCRGFASPESRHWEQVCGGRLCLSNAEATPARATCIC